MKGKLYYGIMLGMCIVLVVGCLNDEAADTVDSSKETEVDVQENGGDSIEEDEEQGEGNEDDAKEEEKLGVFREDVMIEGTIEVTDDKIVVMERVILLRGQL
ncbi:hypothetical protein [Alteribacter populi]|uniref:hypothetical protein n=1 Tax=Alteribacter populi TaxID=2011011 RepID=UPI000BBB442D|nr:hypothetical protein [Alteribacter populi]